MRVARRSSIERKSRMEILIRLASMKTMIGKGILAVVTPLFLLIILTRKTNDDDNVNNATSAAAAVKIKLDYFRDTEYEAARAIHPMDENHCRTVSSVWPTYILCAHPNDSDTLISGPLLQRGAAWEQHVLEFMGQALSNLHDRYTVFLDVGANIGGHAFFAAALRAKVWAVEPLDINLMRFILGNIKFLRHAVDKTRGMVQVKVTEGNIGGSHVLLPGRKKEEKKKETLQSVRAVLLSDIFEEMWHDHTKYGRRESNIPLNVLLKVDVELFECRVFLGSPSVLRDPRFFVPYIIMEWRFMAAEGEESEQCPESMMLEMTGLFVASGYSPFGEVGPYDSLRWVRFDEDDSENWKATNILWRHKDAL